MHHFFSIPELVELVCKELNYSRVHRKDLAALARTATVFHHPALDVLWRQQDGLMNVILCMPADLWESEELVKSWSFALSRPITPSDLERPLIYSRRVKSLYNQNTITRDLGRILEVMKPFLPQGILLPNLRHVDLLLRPAVDVTIIPYLSFALVTSICLQLESWFSLPNLPLVYPALKRLEIKSSSPDPAHSDFLTSTSTYVRKLIQIEELILPTLDRAAYDHLSTLPALRYLHLTEWRTPDPDLFPSVPSHPSGHTGFPVLQRLIAQCMALGSVMEVVNGFSSTPLRHLSVRATSALGPEHRIQHFFAALSTHLVHGALEEIHLWLGVEGEVVTLYLPVLGKILLDDAAVWDMARAWPNLVTLKLIDRQDDSDLLPIITLASLRAFATHCPELITLALTFDATVVPPSSDEQPVLYNKLSDLYVWYSPISSPALVGRFLAEIFPNIERIQSFNHYEPWEEVEDVVMRGGI
ncbi:hypothetical protein C8J57DRAFT_1588040 [Mycena rebaudengoi]|nr:hypothetical protein C8J57DRAFT_1588040 [Mycena rebaudengoi]